MADGMNGSMPDAANRMEAQTADLNLASRRKALQDLAAGVVIVVAGALSNTPSPAQAQEQTAIAATAEVGGDRKIMTIEGELSYSEIINHSNREAILAGLKPSQRAKYSAWILANSYKQLNETILARLPILLSLAKAGQTISKNDQLMLEKLANGSPPNQIALEILKIARFA